MKKNRNFEVVFQDDDILIVNKASGIAVIPERAGKNISVFELLLKSQEELFVVHRIDKETSGLVVFAKTEESHKFLNDEFFNRKVDKQYLAICKNVSGADEFDINAPIAHSNNSSRMRIHHSGKEAISHVKVSESTNNYTLFEINIETGRTHQIRIHMAYTGFPLLGDHLYNDAPDEYLSDFKKKFNKGKKPERPLMQRTALHAHKISFTHPKDHKTVSFESDLPKDMKVCWQLMQKWDK